MNSTCFNKKIMELKSIPPLLPCRSFQVSQIFVLQSDSFCNLLSWLGNEDSGSCFSRCIRLKCWQLLAGRGGWLLMCFAGNFIGGGVKGSPPPLFFFCHLYLSHLCLSTPSQRISLSSIQSEKASTVNRSWPSDKWVCPSPWLPTHRSVTSILLAGSRWESNASRLAFKANEYRKRSHGKATRIWHHVRQQQGGLQSRGVDRRSCQNSNQQLAAVQR